jgi:hypothetical protein
MNWRSFLILLWLAAYGLVGAIVFLNAGGPPVEDIWTTMALGAVFGAVGLVSLWLVFGRSPLVGRSCLGVIALLLFSWLLSLISAEAEVIAFFWLIFQGPQLIVTVIGLAILGRCGWHLHGPGDFAQVVANDPSSRSQFSLGGLLKMIGIVALMLGMGRWLGAGGMEFVVTFAILCGVGILAVALAWLRGFVLFRCGVGALAMGALFAGFCFGKISQAVSLLALTMLLLMTASLAVFRVCGYWLERAPDDRNALAAASRSTDAVVESPAMPAESRL